MCVAPLPSGPCPTTLVFEADGPATDLDSGWTGLSHDAAVPTNSRLTLAVSGCAGASHPTCGTCAVNGPLDNAGGATFDNHRCADASWISCTSDGDCGGAGPCVFFFGPPLALQAGGFPTCVVNRITGPVTGTVNAEDGSSATQVALTSAVYTGPTITNPCPVCRDGRCEDGTRIHQPCTVQGSNHGDVSLDCPPFPGTQIGVLEIDLDLATGTQSRTIESDSPRCRATGHGTRFCRCDTCNNANAETCSANSDCPPSGGNPGVCGGRRCTGGPNFGAPCTLSSQCPTGGCGRLGAETQPHSCGDIEETPIDGSVCQDVGGNEGVCPEGPDTQGCSIETFRSCTSDADCACSTCLQGQTCISVPRPCFIDEGTMGDAVHVVGAPDVPCGGTAFPTVGSLFCIAPVASSSVNTAAGLPGLGRIRIPGRVTVSP